MLSMSGFLKKKLLDSKELPLKWQGFVGSAYNADGSIIKDPNYKTAWFFQNDSNNYYYYSKNFQLDVKYDISLIDEPKQSDTVVCNLMTAGNPGSGIYNVIQVPQRTSTSQYAGKVYCSTTYPNVSDSKVKSASVPEGTKHIWLRIIHVANGSDKLYYSFDGKSYILLNTLTLPKQYWNGAATRQSASVESYSNLEDVRFMVEGKLVFGKVE